MGLRWGTERRWGVRGQLTKEEWEEGRWRRRWFWIEQGKSQVTQKWDQKAWNVYFPIMFSQHVGAIALIILYIPYIFSAVIGFFHFICFLVLVILNICIKDAEPGNGSRTKGTRVVWGSKRSSIQSCASSILCSSSAAWVEFLVSIPDFVAVIYIMSIISTLSRSRGGHWREDITAEDNHAKNTLLRKVGFCRMLFFLGFCIIWPSWTSTIFRLSSWGYA